MKHTLSFLALLCLLAAGCGDKGGAPKGSDTTSKGEKATPESSAKQPKAKGEKKASGTASTPAKKPAPAPKSELQQRLEKMYPMPKYKPLEEIVGNWEKVPQNVIDAVKVVTVNTAADYKLFANGKEIGSSKAQPGHRAKPLKFRPGQLLVTNSRDGNTRAVVNIDDTDFKDQVRSIYNEQVEKGKQRVLAARKASEAALVQSQSSEGGSAEFGGPDSDPRFKPAVDYLKSGKMLTRNFDEAKRWLWLGKETHEGQPYEVILVNFEVETIFGVFPHSMKCLLKNGRVEKWIMAGYGE